MARSVGALDQLGGGGGGGGGTEQSFIVDAFIHW